ncbi:hypothetical protein BHM03_00049779 [Ensete ventricosum]|nr:hypothetical protein BHM03_00049779 [Ensete ventricosum]
MDTRWLITDFVVSALGLKDLLPPYNAADSLDLSDIATGISFASAGSGLDDLTAEQSQVMTMAQELSNFAAYTERLTAALGKKAQDIIGGPLFVIGAGSNDWMMNYYMSPIRSGTYSKVEYSRLLIGKLRSVVEVLHCFLSRAFHAHAHAHAKEFHSNMIDAGERWLEVCHLRASTAGLSSSADHSEGNGVHRPHATTKLRGGAEQRRRRPPCSNPPVDALRASLVRGWFVYVDIYTPLMDMIQNPKRYGKKPFFCPSRSDDLVILPVDTMP